MEFLAGSDLTRKIQEMLRSSQRADLAIAYWGSDALKLLKISPKRRAVRVVCCLKGGKSDPEVIKLFKSKAKQHDNLHAKVIWTPRAAIVSSANASSNGLPEEEGKAVGLIEAGFYTENGAELKSIHSWFDRLYRSRSKKILKPDLDAAALARKIAKLRGGAGKKARGKVKKPSLLELIQKTAGRPDYPISFTICRELTSRAGDRAARKYLTRNSKEMQRKLMIDRGQLEKLDWYVNWPNLPKDTVIIDCHLVGKKMRVFGVNQTFQSTKGIPIKVEGESENYHFVLRRGQQGKDFRLTTDDKKAISDCASKLWDIKKGDDEARCFPLRRAVPLLMDYSEKHQSRARKTRSAR
jgi:hypothetical protein